MNDFSQFLDDMGNMPTNCNGIKRLDETKDFLKINCEWGIRPIGRKALPKIEKVKKIVKRKVQNPKAIYLILERDHIDFIRAQAMHKSVEKGYYIEANELIREALQKAFPTPKQYDMFGDSK